MPFAAIALVLSVCACAGSLYLSLEMHLRACALCFYQRAFAFGLVGVLSTGLLAFREHGARVCLLALPLAIAGLVVAGFHVWLGWTAWPRADVARYLACPAGIESIGTAPQQSLGVFGLIVLALLIGGIGEVRASGRGGPALLAGVVLGVAAGAGSLLANPPVAEPKPLPARPLDTCLPTTRA